MKFKFKNRLNPTINFVFVLLLLLYSILGIYLLKYYQFDLQGGDIISVISIAKLYAEGDFNNAINGYWGPLFSWLLVPFLLLNSSQNYALYSTKILSLIIGFFTLIGIRLLSYRFEMDEIVRLAILFLMIFILLDIALVPIFFPMDLLLLCFLIYYLYFIFDPKYSEKLYIGFLCGIFGALAYLTKSYALPFFIAHFVLFNIFHYFKEFSSEKRRRILKNFFLGFVVFFIICGFWSAAISDKYGEITTGTSGKYNYNLVGPNFSGIPLWNGFTKPTNDKAISAWEDPSYEKLKDWSPLDSWSNFNYQLDIIWENIFRTIGIIQSFSYLAIIILISYIIICLQPIRKIILDNNILYPLATILLYIWGYILIWTEFRYLILVWVMLILMGGYLIDIIFRNISSITNVGKFVLVLFFISSFIILPLSSITKEIDHGKEIYLLSNDLISHYDIHGNLASNGEYHKSMKISYFLNSQYYGTSLNKSQNISDVELENNLKTYKIDYYFVWGKSSNDALLSRYTEVTDGVIPNLRIYRIKGN